MDILTLVRHVAGEVQIEDGEKLFVIRLLVTFPQHAEHIMERTMTYCRRHPSEGMRPIETFRGLYHLERTWKSELGKPKHD